MEFEWDKDKAMRNSEKHGVEFEDAVTVFGDLNAIVIYDGEHSDDEDRYIILEVSKNARLLVVVHTYREPAIRLISAQAAEKRERQEYEKELG